MLINVTICISCTFSLVHLAAQRMAIQVGAFQLMCLKRTRVLQYCYFIVDVGDLPPQDKELRTLYVCACLCMNKGWVGVRHLISFKCVGTQILYIHLLSCMVMSWSREFPLCAFIQWELSQTGLRADLIYRRPALECIDSCSCVPVWARFGSVLLCVCLVC